MIYRCILIIGGMIFLPGALAADCFSPSPSRQADMELTTEIVPRTLSNNELNVISSMIKQLQGQWKGQADETICKGTVNNVNKELIEYTLDLDIRNYRGNELEIKAMLKSLASKKSRNEILKMYITENKFRVNNEFAAGDVEIIKISEYEVSFFRKVVTRTKSGGVSVRELVQSLSLADRQLNMEFTVYFNGVLSSRTLWTAKQKL